MFIHTQNHAPSQNALQLSEQIVEVIREAKKSNAGLNYMDVRQATVLSSHTLREELGGGSLRTQLWLAIGLLLAIMMGGAAFSLLR